MENIIQIKVGDIGQTFLYAIKNVPLKVGDYVIIELDRGLEYGEVISESVADSKEVQESLKKLLRVANQQDLKQIEDNKTKTKEARLNCQKKIEEHKLDMKLVDVEYSFDRSKLIFYFTAQGRVDFRELVKDLAKVFKARIELRQIGVRDEAKLFGGFGPCGRELCCARFLKDFEPVTIKMAKEQGLPLNPPKISGLCGRLMCCLSYEHNVYKEYAKDLPREGEKVNTPEGKGKVVSVNILKRFVVVELGTEGRLIKIDYAKRP